MFIYNGNQRRLTCIKRGRSSSMTIITKMEIIEDHRQGNHHMCGTKINMGNVNYQQ
jgi:hypothetical protein